MAAARVSAKSGSLALRQACRTRCIPLAEMGSTTSAAGRIFILGTLLTASDASTGPLFTGRSEEVRCSAVYVDVRQFNGPSACTGYVHLIPGLLRWRAAI